MRTNLVTTSGRGVQSHIRTTGHFEVRLCNETVPFHLLREAYQFFLDQEEEVSLWDVTSIAELLESKVIDG